MFELLEWQIVIVGIVASVLVQIIRLAGEKFDFKVGEVLIQWLVFGISLGLGLWWGAYEFPVLPVWGGPEALMGFVDFAGAIIALLGQLLGVAYVVYNVLLKKVFDGIQPLKLDV